MATTGDHWSLLFQLWRYSLIISNCSTKTIIDRLLYQLHVQRPALFASFISFMLQGDHCSLLFISYVFDGGHRLLMLPVIWLKAINDCLLYQLCDWRRSMITSIINYMTICMEERHWSLPLSSLCLKAITHHCFDEWQRTSGQSDRWSPFFWVDMVENEWVSPQYRYQQ